MSTSRSRKRFYHHGKLRAALLRAAGKLLEQAGPAALSVRAAARAAGVSHNAPYRHFPQRESLLAALAAEGFSALGEALQDAGARGGLRARGEAYVRFALARPQRFRLMFGGDLRIEKHHVLGQIATGVYDGLAEAFMAQIPGPAGRDASLAAWSLVHGLALLLLDHRIAAAAPQGRTTEGLVREVLSSIRFAARAPQPTA